MDTLFSGDVEYLNDLHFGILLREIGRVQLDTVPQDPEEAFIARTQKFMQILQSEVDRQAQQGTLAQDARSLRTLGLLRTLLQVHTRKDGWHKALINFLRGMLRFESDHSRAQQHALRDAA